MAYYLTIEKRKGEYTPLDITKTNCFTRMSNLKSMGATLQEIDLFTMNFNNEKELRTFLFKNKLVEMKEAGKNLSIRVLHKNKLYKVMYDMFYQKDIDYIADPTKLIRRINNKLYEEDYRFIEKYANNFMNFYDCLSTAAEVREFATTSTKYGTVNRHFRELDENHDNALTRMTKLLIYDYYQTPSGRIEYKNTIKYRNLHAVLAFVNHYDDTIKKETMENNQENTQTKVKKRVKQEHIPGQSSLFDE